MRLTRGDAPGAALRAAALSRAVRRLAKLLGGARTLGAVLTRSGSNELKRARDIDEAWSEVTIEAAASLPAPVGQDELAVIAALIRDRAGGAHPVVLVFALMWQSPERRAQVRARRGRLALGALRLRARRQAGPRHRAGPPLARPRAQSTRSLRDSLRLEPPPV